MTKEKNELLFYLYFAFLLKEYPELAERLNEDVGGGEMQNKNDTIHECNCVSCDERRG